MKHLNQERGKVTFAHCGGGKSKGVDKPRSHIVFSSLEAHKKVSQQAQSLDTRTS